MSAQNLTKLKQVYDTTCDELEYLIKEAQRENIPVSGWDAFYRGRRTRPTAQQAIELSNYLAHYGEGSETLRLRNLTTLLYTGK